MAQMKEQINTPEKELSDEEIFNLSDAELKTLIIRMLRKLIELQNEGTNEGFPKRNKAKYSGNQQ